MLSASNDGSATDAERPEGSSAPLDLRQGPAPIRFDFELWTRRIMVDLVARKFNKKCDRARSVICRARDHVAENHCGRSYERDPVAIAKWKEQDYPKLTASSANSTSR
jgi:hypothetical protein